MTPKDDAIIGTDTAPLRAMATAIGGEIGVDFLRKVAVTFRDAMQVDLVLITAGLGTPATRARVIYALSDGNPEFFEYDLDGTPCLNVYGGREVIVPCNLAEQFPREAGLEAYAGVPLRTADGTVMGHFAVFSTRPISEIETVKDILLIFGARIEADMRRKALLDERQTLVEELMRTNDALRDRSQALHDANAFKTALMGMIAHDMRNPLAALVASAELLQTRITRGDLDGEKALRDVGKVLAGADRLSTMITTTLDRCRAESSNIEIRVRPTDIAQLVTTALETNASGAAAKGILLTADVAEDIAAEIDEGLCLDALDNLVSNAVKYSPPDTRVQVTARLVSDTVEFRVCDQGLGLSAQDQRLAFRSFQTLSARPTGGESATGLGLANVRRIAEAHGGSVRAQSAGPGLGSTFTLTLPRQNAGRLSV